jgi:hypothetical protein
MKYETHEFFYNDQFDVFCSISFCTAKEGSY